MTYRQKKSTIFRVDDDSNILQNFEIKIKSHHIWDRRTYQSLHPRYAPVATVLRMVLKSSIVPPACVILINILSPFVNQMLELISLMSCFLVVIVLEHPELYTRRTNKIEAPGCPAAPTVDTGHRKTVLKWTLSTHFQIEDRSLHSHEALSVLEHPRAIHKLFPFDFEHLFRHECCGNVISQLSLFLVEITLPCS